MKRKFLLLIGAFLISSCLGEKEGELITSQVEFRQINSIDFGEFSGIKDIILYDDSYYLLAWGQSKLIKMVDGKVKSMSPGRGNDLGEFQSVPEKFTIVNDTVYVLERDSRFINRYNLDLKPIDRIQIPLKFPSGRSLNIINDSLLVVSSLMTDGNSLNLYTLNLDHVKSLTLTQEIGHVLWDVKYLSVLSDNIIVGYPFSGKVEILSHKGNLLNYFDTGSEILNIQVPNFDKNENWIPDGVNFLSIQALNENSIMFFTPKNKDGLHEITLVDIKGTLIGKGFLEGTFQYIHAINGNIYGYNQETSMIEIFAVLQ